MISIIAAKSRNNVIGKNNTLPWHLSADLKYFKSVTSGKTVIMGRKTWESLPSGALPNRTNIVVSRHDMNFTQPNCLHFYNLNDAIAHTRSAGEHAFIIGGGEIYKASLHLADELHITEVDVDIKNGDVFFPEINKDEWELVNIKQFDCSQETHFFQTHIYKRNV